MPTLLAPSTKTIQDNCVLCQEILKENSVNHANAKHAGFHTKCFEDLLDNADHCPTCRDPLDQNLTQTQKIFKTSQKALQAIALAFEHSYTPQVLAALSLAAFTTFNADQTYCTRHILAILGAGYLSSALTVSLPIRFRNAKQASELSISKYAPLTAIVASAVALVASLNGVERHTTICATIAVLGLLFNTGKVAMIKAAVLASIVNLSTFRNAISDQIGAGAGAFARIRNVPHLITIFSAFSGAAAAHSINNLFQFLHPIPRAILSAAIGGIASASAVEIIDKGYRTYEEEGFKLF